MDDEGSYPTHDIPAFPFPAGMQSLVQVTWVEGRGATIRMMPMPWVTEVAPEWRDELFEDSLGVDEKTRYFMPDGSEAEVPLGNFPPPLFLFLAVFSDGRVVQHMTPNKYDVARILLNPETLREAYEDFEETRGVLCPLDATGGLAIASREFIQWWMRTILHVPGDVTDYAAPAAWGEGAEENIKDILSGLDDI